jgi:hypothetical protein
MTAITLTNRVLSIASIQYLWNSGMQTIQLKITTSGVHNIFGSVNIQLTNCQNISVIDKSNFQTITNYFNSQLFQFTAISTTELICNIINVRPLLLTEVTALSTLQNNGNLIIATATQNYYDVQCNGYSGVYTYLEPTLLVKGNATIRVYIKNLGGTSYNSEYDEYDVVNQAILMNIHGQGFNSTNSNGTLFRFELNNASATTNIAINFDKK